jgi:enoyl-[acyl-carrier protein] reductase III
VTNHKQDSWALILGVSSGFGAASALALARNGFNIAGVHLDRRATRANADRIAGTIRGMGKKALFFNVNAADAERRGEVIQSCREAIAAENEADGFRIVVHSLAFGTLKPYIDTISAGRIKQSDMTMTLDVMAHSLVYWVQELFDAGLLVKGGMIFALTSAGAHRVWPAYGAVSAAKAALESHVRQLAVELSPFSISVNAIQAGVTDTPASRSIPGSERMFERAREANPGRRLTIPEDVAEFIAALGSSTTSAITSAWMTGNVIRVDGGEDIV